MIFSSAYKFAWAELFLFTILRPMRFVNHFIKVVFAFVLVSSLSVFAQEESSPVQADSAQNAQTQVVPATVFFSEMNMRDSIIGARDYACKAEGDSLRNVIASEQVKSSNWEQSYETVKKDNEVCQKALRVTIDSQTEKKKGGDGDAALMASSSFFGGIALGMLLFWLIFD